jgi:hypothetical protein
MKMSSNPEMGPPAPSKSATPPGGKAGEGVLEKVRKAFPKEYREGFKVGVIAGIEKTFRDLVYWLSLVPYRICDDFNLASDYSKSIVSVLWWVRRKTVEEVTDEEVEKMLITSYYWPYRLLKLERDSGETSWYMLGLVDGVKRGIAWAKAVLLEFLCTRPADGEFFYPEPFVEKFRKIIFEY